MSDPSVRPGGLTRDDNGWVDRGLWFVDLPVSCILNPVSYFDYSRPVLV